MKLIYLAIAVAHLLLPVSAQSDCVALNMDADLIRWEAYLAYGSYALSNDIKTDLISSYSDRVCINYPVIAEDLKWHYLIGIDWHACGFEGIEDNLGLYADDQLIQTQTYVERFKSILSSIQYFGFSLGPSIAKWDSFTYDFDSIPTENTVPMPAIILLICFGLIGLTGFARKMTKV